MRLLDQDLIEIVRLRNVPSEKMLLVTRTDDGAARTIAIDGRQVDIRGLHASELKALRPPEAQSYDVVVLSELDLAESGAPRFLEEVSQALSPAGLLLVTSRKPVPHQMRERVYLSLMSAGFGRIWFHDASRFDFLRGLSAIVGIHRRTVVSAQPMRDRGAARTCSVIVPVYNERETFPKLMAALMEKDLSHLGLKKEIILVESNSTDGTREFVAHYENAPGVKVVYQQAARGKGNAVREGFSVVTGDIVLIQDADLEYDVADYDALLLPLMQNRASFVLGARLGGKLKMRSFEDQPLVGNLLNLGQVLFTSLVNLLYGQHMADPFTMFKVLRRDCLFGLKFECNRFDFDHELVIKLVLKGYAPLEIPVNYRSRSFKQGKKVRIVRDALSWLRADLGFRFARLRPHFD